MIVERFAVVRIPFPFSDRAGSKPRPALVLSTRAFNAAAGLPAASYVRLKLFTLENALILRTSGALAAVDAASVRRAMRTVLG